MQKKFDFDEMIDRRNSGCVKWNVSENELPMWIADMDFKTAPAITEALKRRVEHGVYGYTSISEEWYDAVINWWDRRHNFKIEKEWLKFSTGVIPVINSAIKSMTNIGDNILVQSPVYNHFFISIKEQGRQVLENELIYENGAYSIDFEDLEKKLAEPLTTMMILCNPQNPAGKIWSREELARIGALCKKYDVVVVSDEIHCDLTAPNREYIPFASVSEECKENSIVCIAPTKTFNLAGVQTAAAVIPNQKIRRIMQRSLSVDGVSMPNAFAIDAATAAFNEGEEWLNELREYIAENKAFVTEYLEKNLPQVKAVASEATYLMWLDFSELGEKDVTDLCNFIREKTGLFLLEGKIYGESGAQFMRLNVACQRERVADGMERLKQGVEAWRG